MDTKEILKQINSQEPTFLKVAKRQVKHKATYICPLCNNGAGKTGDGIVRNNDNKYTCFKCGNIRLSSVFDLWAFNSGISDLKALDNDKALYFQTVKACASYYGLQCDEPEPVKSEYKPLTITDTPQEPQQEVKPQEQEPAKAFDIQEVDSTTSEYKQALEYLKKREIQDTVLNTGLVKVGKITSKSSGFSFIGLYSQNISNGYDIRSIQDNIKSPKVKSGIGDISLFFNKNGNIIFITEGLFDSLSLLQCGLDSICLNSTSNKSKLIDYLIKNKKDLKYKTFLLALDNDKSGITTTDDIYNLRLDLGLDIRKTDLFKDTNYKDINDYNVKAPKDFYQALTDLVNEVRTTIKYNQDTFFYWWNFKRPLEQAIRNNIIDTGIEPLNNILGGGLPVGLTVLGALSGIGKTTLLTQIGEHIASNDTYVLFFSLEQSQNELLSKGLIRNLFFNGEIGIDKDDYDNVKSFNDKVKWYYKLVECDFDTTVFMIDDYIKDIKAKDTKANIVVIVDYLQALKPCDMTTGAFKNINDTKVATDKVIQDLKILSKNYSIPIITVSSLNRVNYYTKIEIDSFKETGNIEYTSDIILALDFRSVREKVLIGKDKEKAEIKNLVDEGLKEDIREVSLYTLKNRFYKPRLQANITFYAKYGAFCYEPDKE